MPGWKDIASSAFRTSLRGFFSSTILQECNKKSGGDQTLAHLAQENQATMQDWKLLAGKTRVKSKRKIFHSKSCSL